MRVGGGSSSWQSRGTRVGVRKGTDLCCATPPEKTSPPDLQGEGREIEGSVCVRDNTSKSLEKAEFRECIKKEPLVDLFSLPTWKILFFGQPSPVKYQIQVQVAPVRAATNHSGHEHPRHSFSQENWASEQLTCWHLVDTMELVIAQFPSLLWPSGSSLLVTYPKVDLKNFFCLSCYCLLPILFIFYPHLSNY